MRKELYFLLLIFIGSMVNGQNSNMKLITPPYLQKGDTIAMVAPAGILKNRKQVIDKAKELVESWGLKVVYGKHLFNQNDHFAGTDEERCQDFQEALDNPTIKAIWSARGGYGSVRIIDQLDFTKFKQHPKWVIGYSDITAFHNHIHNLGVETLHAMMGTSMEEKPEETIQTIATFKKALFGEELRYEVLSSKMNRVGETSGELVGGNIAILASMLGSDSQISTDGKILFIEEIGEYKYSIDRMLQSLKRAGYFTKVKAIIVGNMTKVKKNTTPWGSSIEQLILDVVPKDIPVLFNFPAGHEPDNRALIMGRKVSLSIHKDNTSTVAFD
ncbi:muramoyltetrapeptide carboxypeptidase [Tenacibaculum caenipelagi]|uniref:Muramoyltetrapeptide carboxypeptidase n=2 Tax=Tenacibaculum caenipelagi TaxID=1325435 RepID=A0A4R6TET3_9FLAO|nr:muramoyltetrapeptide carboxypeptidase [Tenacibaculum caenipelagi]